MKLKNFDEFIESELSDPELAAEYLSASIEGGSMPEFLIALRNVANSHGGLGAVSEMTSLNRQNLYKMLAEDGNPTLSSLITILDALGMNITISPKDDVAA